MQTQQFDNLMNGKDAKWALLSELEAPFNPKGEKAENRKLIEDKEVEIPIGVRNQINNFIEEQKKLNVKTRTIRRMVKRKFNITVV